MSGNVIHLPKARAQAEWLQKLSRRDRLMQVAITVMPDDDEFREQRAWRVLFGLYQDCACVRWSHGFEKTPGEPFEGKMRSSMLDAFLHEALPYVAAGRAKVTINGEPLRRRLMEVMAA